MMNIFNGNLKIAIQKDGRLSEDSLNLLRSIGLEFDRSDRQLYAKCQNLGVSILFVRNKDIPEFVETGVADLGIVGNDVVEEGSNEVKLLQKLNFGKCKLSLAVKNGSNIAGIKDLQNKTIATSFPNITKRFFTEKGISIDTVTLAGGVELAPNLGISDGIVDIVSTGYTMKINNLQPVSDLLDIQAGLIAGKNIDSKKQELVDQILLRIASVQKALNYKYIMMNLPIDRLEAIQRIVPGLKSPTVANLVKENWISVQTVIQESTFWEIIELLKRNGAEGIIVTPIEKIIN